MKKTGLIRLTSLILSAAFILCTVPTVAAAKEKKKGDVFSFTMETDLYSANIEVTNVLDYEYIDNTDSVPEFYNSEELEDGTLIAEFSKLHIIYVDSDALVRFIKFNYNNSDETHIVLKNYINPEMIDKAKIKSNGLYRLPLKEGWDFQLFDFAEASVETIYLLYDTTEGDTKSEAYMIRVSEAIYDVIPLINRGPFTINSTIYLDDYFAGRAPIKNYLGELALDQGVQFGVPDTDISINSPDASPDNTFSLFVTDDGTMDIDYLTCCPDKDLDFGDTHDAIVYSYEAVQEGTSINFKLTDSEILTSPYEKTVSLSGFFATAVTLVDKNLDSEPIPNAIFGVILSKEEVEEYRSTGKIAKYPDIDWSVLGPIYDEPFETHSVVELKDGTMSINMDQGELGAIFEITGVLDYEFIDNSASFKETIKQRTYAINEGYAYSMEYPKTHIISVSSDAKIKFIDFTHNDLNQKDKVLHALADCELDKTKMKYTDALSHPLYPSWTYDFSQNITASKKDAVVFYNRSYERTDSEVFIIQVTEEVQNETPIIDREPYFSNPVMRDYFYAVAIAPIPNYYGEVASNFGTKTNFANNDLYTVEVDDPENVYSVFITDDGTLDIDFWMENYISTDEFGEAADITIYTYEPTWDDEYITFEPTDIKKILSSPYEYTANVSGFFKVQISAKIYDDNHEGVVYTGIVLSKAEVEEYRSTGTIANYPDFDWSVLGPVEVQSAGTSSKGSNPDTGASGNSLVLIIGGISTICAVGMIRRRKTSETNK